MTTPKGCYLLLVIPVVMVTAQDYPHAYPANDYEHSVRRDYLLRQEKQFQKGRPQLSEVSACFTINRPTSLLW